MQRGIPESSYLDIVALIENQRRTRELPIHLDHVSLLTIRSAEFICYDEFSFLSLVTKSKV